MKPPLLHAVLALSALPLAHLFAQDPTPPTTEGAPQKAPLLSGTKTNHVVLLKSALDREFLFSASVIPQMVAPTSTALAGKIVRFEVFHDGVDLYESTEGLVVTKDLPARRLLTTFPIVAQDDKTVTIDFNSGMRRVFSDIWYASSPVGAAVHAGVAQARSLEIPQGRVFEVKAEDDLLTIRQSAQVRDRQNDQNKEDRYEIRYFISPYEPGDFRTKEHSPAVSRYVRFFELHPEIEQTTGRTSNRIALFDIRTPVVIYYSANTPTEHESAVKDGILYWNRAFGREVVKAEKAPEGITAPDARFNLIQWVPWDSAGFAYADIIIDPRSGASRRGQTYLTSTFSINSRSRARALLRNLRTTAIAPKPAPPKPGATESSSIQETTSSNVSKFATARACELDSSEFAENLAGALEAALADPRLSDESIKRLSGDYLREVVAHEVGHMLGLRHNFAGSLSTTLNHRELDDWFKAYLADDNTKQLADRLPSSSVMDYMDMRASALIGWKIRKTAEVLPYDLAAIRWGYFNANDVADKKMLFATDQDTQTYGDVDRFDYGAEPFISAYASIGEELKNLPNALIEQFIAAKAPRDPRDKKPLEQLNLDPDRALTRLGDAYGRMLSWFKAGRRSLRVEQAFPFVGPLNQREVVQAHWKALNTQVEKLGGIDRAVFSYLPLDLKLELKVEPTGAQAVEKIDAKKLQERLAQLLESPDYTSFTGLDEKPASFTKEDKEVILRRGKAYFEELEKESLKRFCQKLEKAQRDLGVQALEEVSEEDVVAKLERRIIDVAREIVMARNEERHHKGKVDKATIEVTDFRYDLETRVAAARMLSDGAGSFRNWCAEPRSELGKQLKESVDAALNLQNLREFKEASLSRTLRDWYLNQQSVIGLLSGRGMPLPPPPAPSAPKPHTP